MEVSIKLYWNYLKFDIDQETFKAAKVQITGDENAEIRNEAQTGATDFDKYYCIRKIEEAIVGVRHILHKFFSSVTRTTSDTIEDDSDQYSKNVESWGLAFEFDGRRSVDSEGLAHEIHKYIVLNVLQEWSKIAMPTMEKNYYERLIVEENRIKAMCFRKEEPTLDV